MAAIDDVLVKCRQEQFSTLIHRTVDQMLGRIGPQYQDYSDSLSLDEWWKVTDWIKDICRLCGKQSIDKEKMHKILGDIPEIYRDAFTDVALIRREELRQIQLNATVANLGCHLKDFDWKLKLVLSSDKLASVKEPLITVQFTTEVSGESQYFDLELNKEEMKQLITSLEAANKVLMQLKV